MACQAHLNLHCCCCGRAQFLSLLHAMDSCLQRDSCCPDMQEPRPLQVAPPGSLQPQCSSLLPPQSATPGMAPPGCLHLAGRHPCAGKLLLCLPATHSGLEAHHHLRLHHTAMSATGKPPQGAQCHVRLCSLGHQGGNNLEVTHDISLTQQASRKMLPEHPHPTRLLQPLQVGAPCSLHSQCCLLPPGQPSARQPTPEQPLQRNCRPKLLQQPPRMHLRPTTLNDHCGGLLAAPPPSGSHAPGPSLERHNCCLQLPLGLTIPEAAPRTLQRDSRCLLLPGMHACCHLTGGVALPLALHELHCCLDSPVVLTLHVHAPGSLHPRGCGLLQQQGTLTPYCRC